MEKTALLIDLSSIVHPIWHTSQSEPDPNHTSVQTVAKVRALASGQPHVAVCCDSGRSFRAEVDPTYKANRPESDATLQHQITLARETLLGDGAVRGVQGLPDPLPALVEAGVPDSPALEQPAVTVGGHGRQPLRGALSSPTRGRGGRL